MASHPSSVPTVAIAGLGGFAAQHHAALAHLEREGECRVVATCDPHPENAPADLHARGVKVYPDLDTLLANHAPDLVTLPTPIPLHAAQHAAVVRNGAGCYLEKPPTLWWPEYLEMLEVEKAAKHRTQVGFNFVGDPFRLGLKRRIQAGEFGRLKTASLLAVWPRDRAYYTRNDWAGRMKIGDRWVLDSPLGNAVAHYVQNLLVWADAMGIDTVQSLVYRAHPIDNYDTAFVRLETNGVEIRLAVTHCGDVPAFNHETLTFERATIHFDDWRTARIEHPDGRTEHLESEYRDQFELLCGNLRHTLRYLRGEEPAPITPLDTCAPFVAINSLTPFAGVSIYFFPEERKRVRENGQIVVDGLNEALAAFAHEGQWPEEPPDPITSDDLQDLE